MFLIWLVQLLVIYKTFDKNNQPIIFSHQSLGVTMTTLKIYGDACNIYLKLKYI
jgi:lipopolysaccharide/colanic/teichoic acid biosynthesis glycosyltransferase